MKQIFYLALVTLGIAACKGTTADPNANQPQNTVPQTIYYQVTVNDLRLREQPTQTSKVVCMVKENEKLEYLGEKSGHTDAIELRGVKYNEPWYKVKTTAGQLGWAYGGAIREIKSAATGTDVSDIDQTKIKDLKDYIAPLNAKDPASFTKALEYYTKSVAGVNAATCDAAYRPLWEFGNTIISNLEQNLYRDLNMSDAETDKLVTSVYESKIEANSNPYVNKIVSNSFTFGAVEGSLYLRIDNVKFNAYLLTCVSEAMKQFLNQQAEEDLNIIVDDMGITITADEFAKRIAFWENFCRDYPNFVEAETAKENLKNLRSILFSTKTALDNTPIYDYQSHKLSEFYRQTYESLFKNYPNCYSAIQAKQLYEAFKKNGFKQSAEMDKMMNGFLN